MFPAHFVSVFAVTMWSCLSLLLWPLCGGFNLLKLRLSLWVFFKKLMSLKIYNWLVWFVSSCLNQCRWFKSFVGDVTWFQNVLCCFQVKLFLGCSGCRRRLSWQKKVWVGLTMFDSLTLFQIVLCCFRSFYVPWVVAGCSFFLKCLCYPKWFKFVRVVSIVQAVIGRRSFSGCIGMFIFVMLSCFFFTVHIAPGCGQKFQEVWSGSFRLFWVPQDDACCFIIFLFFVLFFYHIKLFPLFQRSLNSLSCLDGYWLMFV